MGSAKDYLIAVIKRSRFSLIFQELYWWFKNPYHQLLVWNDYIKTKVETRFIRDLYADDGVRKKALIIPFGSVQGSKLESLLGLGLMRSGWNVGVFFKGRGNLWAIRYFRLFSISQHYFEEDFRSDEISIGQLYKDLHKRLGGVLEFSDVKEWSYKGINIGPTLLSNIQRQNRLGAPDLKNKLVVQQLKRKLPEIINWLDTCDRLLSDTCPDLIFLIEANDWNRPLVELAINKGIDVVQVVQPFRDDALIFKRLNKRTFGINPNSVDTTTLQKIMSNDWSDDKEDRLNKEMFDRYDGKWYLQKRNQPNVVNFNKPDIINEFGFNSDKKIAVVFSHILWDANLFYGEDLFEDYSDWFINTVRAACQCESVNWLIKLHPANLWKRSFENEQGELAEISVLKKHNLWPLPRHVVIMMPSTNVSSLSLYKSIDYAVTVRGTPGIELPCFGVPVFTAGTGRYSGFGFTIESDSKEEYLQKLANINAYDRLREDQIQIAKWHAYSIFLLRPWSFSSFVCEFGKIKGFHPLAFNIRMNVKSMLEIDANGDLKKWSKWINDPNKLVDYYEWTS